MTLHQRQKIERAITAERRAGKMRVGRQIAAGRLLPRGAQIGEIAAPPARNQDLPARLPGMVKQQHPPPALARDPCTKQPRRPRAQHDNIMGNTHEPSNATAKASATLIPSTAADKIPPA